MVVLLFLADRASSWGCVRASPALEPARSTAFRYPNAKRNRMVFAQATISGVLAIIVVWVTKDLLVSDQPMQRHIVVMWCGVVAMFAAGVSFAGVRIFEEDHTPATPAPSKETQTIGRTGNRFQNRNGLPLVPQVPVARLIVCLGRTGHAVLHDPRRNLSCRHQTLAQLFCDRCQRRRGDRVDHLGMAQRSDFSQSR